jgi:2-amino-4-hydroxy-6-hydroxymethyldihydropteridine diphosphokinase
MTPATSHRYLVALGSNRRHHRFGRPRDVLTAALERLEREGISVVEAAPVMFSKPVGPSLRRYANSAALVETVLEPPALLALLKRVERAFGRRPRGQRWASRVLDLDVVLWGGGCFSAPDLTIPHPLFRERPFVLAPAAAIASGWRDPVTGLSVRQINARLTSPRAVRRAAAWSGP